MKFVKSFLSLFVLFFWVFSIQGQITNGSYVSNSGPFGQPSLRTQYVDNILYAALSRFSVSATVGPVNDGLFDGSYEGIACLIPAGNTSVITIDFTGKGGSNIVYPSGQVYLHFYYTGIPASVSGRIQRNDGTWFNLTNWSNISLLNGCAVWKGTVPGFNAATVLELTIQAQAGINANLNEIEYVHDRSSAYEPGVVTKFVDNTLYKNLNWRNSSNGLVGSIKNDGSAFFNGAMGIGTASPVFSANNAKFLTVSGESIGANNIGEIGAGGNITTTTAYVGTFSFYNSAIGATEKRVGVISAQNQGATNTASLQFTTMNAGTLGERMRITADGNIGIGTSTPAQKLDVSGNIKSTGFILPTGAAAGKVLTSDANGNATWQPAASAGWSYDGNTVGVLKKIGTTDNYALPFITNNVERMRIGTNGNIGIGTANINDASYKLFVETGIRTRKVKVDQTTWADYVFLPSYKLPSLTEVEAYIKQHQHLPEIPSAKDVAQNGLDLGDNQAALLKKIEELTLYVIQQQKEIDELKKGIEVAGKDTRQRTK